MVDEDWDVTCPGDKNGHCYHYTGDSDGGVNEETGELWEPGGDSCCWCGREPGVTPADAVPVKTGVSWDWVVR